MASIYRVLIKYYVWLLIHWFLKTAIKDGKELTTTNKLCLVTTSHKVNVKALEHATCPENYQSSITFISWLNKLSTGAPTVAQWIKNLI